MCCAIRISRLSSFMLIDAVILLITKLITVAHKTKFRKQVLSQLKLSTLNSFLQILPLSTNLKILVAWKCCWSSAWCSSCCAPPSWTGHMTIRPSTEEALTPKYSMSSSLLSFQSHCALPSHRSPSSSYSTIDSLCPPATIEHRRSPPTTHPWTATQRRFVVSIFWAPVGEWFQFCFKKRNKITKSPLISPDKRKACRRSSQCLCAIKSIEGSARGTRQGAWSLPSSVNSRTSNCWWRSATCPRSRSRMDLKGYKVKIQAQ